MGKAEKLQKALEKQGGIFGDSKTPETKEVQAQLRPGQIPLPTWGIPLSEEKAIERMFSYQRRSLEEFYKMGKTLNWLKENQTQHGEWGEYLKSKVDIAERTAHRFMDFAKRADNLGHLPPTLEERKALPAKRKKKIATVANLEQGASGEVSELKAEVKTLRSQAKETERNLEAERKAREKAEKLAKEAEERFERERSEAGAEKPPKPETTTDPFIVELAPGFKREEVNKGLISWFWRSQGKVRSARKQVIIHLDIKALGNAIEETDQGDRQ
jgi:hypothetical protein